MGVNGAGKAPTLWRILLLGVGAAAGGLLLILMLVLGLPTMLWGTGVFDPEGNLRGSDFLTHYTAGKMVLAGQAASLYDQPVQSAAQEAVFGIPLDHTAPYLLPPAAALIFAPFALLPFPVAATLWAMLTVALMIFSLCLVWPLSPLRGQLPSALPMIALLGTYPVGMNLVGGNNAALWLTIYALGSRYLLGGQAVAAGVVLGFGALKPQLFLAVPVLLLVQRRWRTLGAAAGVATLLAAMSLLMVGLDGARQYVAFLTSSTYEDKVAIANAWRMLSLPAFARGIWPDLPTLATTAIILGGLVLLGWAVRRAPLPTAYAAAVLVSVLIDPHCFLYDSLVLAVPILLRAGGAGWGTPWWLLAALWLITWWMLFRMPPAPGTLWAIPWAVLPLTGLAIAALHDARLQLGERLVKN